MATGRSGQNGKIVPELVEADSTHALEPAQIPLLAVAEKIALRNPMKLVHVTLSLVQVQKCTVPLNVCLDNAVSTKSTAKIW